MPPPPRRPVSPRRLLAVVLVLSAALGWVGYAVVYPEWHADGLLAQADRAAADGDYARARRLFEDVSGYRPKDSRVRFLLARTCRRADDLAAAGGHLHEARRLGWVPDAVVLEGHLIEAQQVGPRGENEATLHVLALTRHPDERVILEALVKGYRNAHRPEAAVRWLGVWIDRYPDDWMPRLWRGDLFDAFNFSDDARADFLRVVELRPATADAHRHLGQLELSHLHDAGVAAGHFRALLALAPGDPDGLLGLAECHRVGNDPEAARGLLGELLARDPGNALACLELAVLDADAGRPAAARAWADRAAAGLPDDPQPHYRLGLLQDRLGRPAEAARHLRRFRELDDGFREVMDLTKKLLADPSSADLRARIGVVFLRLGKPETAFAWLSSAVLENASHPGAHRALADYYERAGQPGTAARHRQLGGDSAAGGKR